ncbi:MAG: hypothetical protein JW940_33920 [Polyangiaceae bacterium]|nr:hypothetical protein [Polyangiaceae bacterium]
MTIALERASVGNETRPRLAVVAGDIPTPTLRPVTALRIGDCVGQGQLVFFASSAEYLYGCNTTLGKSAVVMRGGAP